MCQSFPASMTARSSLSLIVAAVQVLALTLRTAADPCLQSRLQSAFLKGVVDGLPADTLVTFCNDTSSQIFVHGEDTGVQHFVFSGHIPQHLLGKHLGRWQRVRHNQMVSRGPNALPALLHLWIRALCSRYKSNIGRSARCCTSSRSRCNAARQPLRFCSGCITAQTQRMQGHNHCQSFWNAARRL